MAPKQILLLAVLGEAVLAGAALGWASATELPLERGGVVPAVILGTATAALFVAGNYYVLRHAPAVPGVQGIRRLHIEVLRPLLARIGVVEVVGISLAAGLGEELLFRGVVQVELGLVPASLLFGAAHVGSGGGMAFAVWATLLGGILGLLAIASGGWLAPAVAHAIYDAAALAFIRWAPDAALHATRS